VKEIEGVIKMYVTNLLDGRPVDETGRLEKEIKTYNVLDTLGIDYQRLDHDVANTIDDCTEIDARLEATICKNLFLCNSQKTEFYLLMMPGEKKFVTKVVSKLLGKSRLSFAKPEHMAELLDITPGSVSIMGLVNDIERKVTLVIDKAVLEGNYIGLHPCINTSSLRVKTKDILEKFLPYTKHEPIVIEIE